MNADGIGAHIQATAGFRYFFPRIPITTPKRIQFIILPETELDAAQGLIDKIQQESSRLEMPEALKELNPRLLCGLAQWQKGFDSRMLIERAAELLQIQLASHTAPAH